MQVIEIKKHITNGTKIGYIMLDDINDLEEIEEHIEDWCLNEPNGHGNVWRSEWRIIIDEEHRSKIIHDEVLKMDRHISPLMKKRDALLGEITVSFVQLKSEN
jgi:hypothetical protein